MFHVGRRTVMTKLIVAFRNFANAPNDERRVEVPPQLKLPRSVTSTLEPVNDRRRARSLTGNLANETDPLHT